MKSLKFVALFLAALIVAVPCVASERAAEPASAQAQGELNLNNGIQAGMALLSLYKQYKSNGKLDLTNASNITSLLSLASNIKGLKSGDNNTSFLSGLMQGSSNLVNKSNSSTVLNTLSSLAGMNINKDSLKDTAAEATVSGVLSKLVSRSSSSTSNTASQASSLLTTLFSGLK